MTSHSVAGIVVTDEEKSHLRKWVHARLEAKKPSELPFSFSYDGRPSAELLGDWRAERRSPRPLDGSRIEHVLTWTDPRTALALRCVAVEYLHYPVIEWTLSFKNTGASATPIIESVQALDTCFTRPAEGEFVLHHSTGSPARADDYAPHETRLGPGAAMRFGGRGGRASDTEMPYFNLEWRGGGAIIVFGWPGQWAAEFERDAGSAVHVRGGQEATHFRLYPGEEVRSPLIVLLLHRGEWIRSQNLWRRWMLEHNVPRLGGALPPPFMPAGSSAHFHEMENANEENQKLFIDRFLEEGIKIDVWWMDAGWYVTQTGRWWEVGTWEVDRKRFPNGLRAVTEHARSRGLKCVVWFEPERVYPNSWLDKNHPEWLLGKQGGTKLLDLGNPEAWKWVVNHFDWLIREEGVGIYRQDFNMAPLDYWRANDAPDRQGITEIRHIMGYLAYWDELRRRHPAMLIDTCASGGRRNDLETLRRSIPLHKSDHDYGDSAARQCQHYGLALWVPFFGAATCWLDQVSAYDLRNAFAWMTGLGYDVRRKDLDYALLRKLTAEWREVSPYFAGDFYPLTPYSTAQDVWLAWQYDRPDLGEGMVQAFRRAESPHVSAHFKLRGLEPDSTYILRDFDKEDTAKITGRELIEAGLSLTLEARPAAATIQYKKLKQ